MSRETALRVLIACRTNGAWADAALQAQIKRAALSRRDAALCSRLVYGVLQNQLLLDFYIGTYCSQRPDHLQPVSYTHLQEVNRESNTIGSKCGDVSIAQVVVNLKAEVEKMREQVQNVE